MWAPISLSPLLLLLAHTARAHFHASHLAPLVALSSTALRTLHPYPFALLLAGALALHGLRKRSLSPSGAGAAFAVGYASLATPLSTFGWMLLVFYLLGSRATKVKAARKAELEDGHDPLKVGGYRVASQVFANSLLGAASSLLWRVLHSGELDPSHPTLSKFGARPFADGGAWCAVDLAPNGSAWSRTLVLLALGHYACCNADTLASELGILSRTPPRLITTFRPVPPGTNGGVTPLGTLLSLLGGALIGLVASLGLAFDNPACSTRGWETQLQLVALGAGAGLFGSLLDSLLGATLQRTLLSKERGKILTDLSDVGSHKEAKVVSGWDVLSNTQVNVVSSAVTAGLTAWVGSRL